MPDLAIFPDIETAVLLLLDDLGATTGIETPNNLALVCPFIRVRSLGGSDDRFNDHSRIDLDVFSPLRVTAKSLAELVRQRLLSFPHVLTSCVIDEVTTEVSPQEIPWSNTAIRLVAATYSATTRRNSPS